MFGTARLQEGGREIKPVMKDSSLHRMLREDVHATTVETNVAGGGVIACRSMITQGRFPNDVSLVL